MPEILKEDMKEICKVEGNGYCLIESIIEALAQDYDIYYSKDELIENISKELCDKPDYTRYLRQPFTQEEVNFNLLNMTTSKTYSRVVTDMYLPAISSALDLHIKTIQNISGYYAIVNTLPINTIDEFSTKTITLIIQDGIYQPVVDMKGPMIPTPSNSPPSAKFNPSPIFRAKPPSAAQIIVISDDSSENVSPCSSPTAISSPIIIQPEQDREDPFLQLSKDADALISRLKEEPEEEDLVDISWNDALVFRNGQRRTSFDMNPFKGMIPDVVEKIPYDINGTKYYMIDVPEDQQFFVKYRDGRYFEMNTSTRKGFRGVRRLGKCRGNFVCRNPGCPYYLEKKSMNQHQFSTIGKNKFCFSCNGIVYREPCNALKLIEFHIQKRVLEVYHLGEHTCQVKPDPKENDREIEETVRKYGPNVTPKQMAQMKMTEELNKQFNS